MSDEQRAASVRGRLEAHGARVDRVGIGWAFFRLPENHGFGARGTLDTLERIQKDFGPGHSFRFEKIEGGQLYVALLLPAKAIWAGNLRRVPPKNWKPDVLEAWMLGGQRIWEEMKKHPHTAEGGWPWSSPTSLAKAMHHSYERCMRGFLDTGKPVAWDELLRPAQLAWIAVACTNLLRPSVFYLHEHPPDPEADLSRRSVTAWIDNNDNHGPAAPPPDDRPYAAPGHRLTAADLGAPPTEEKLNRIEEGEQT